MTKLEAAAISWHEHILSRHEGKLIFAALHLKQHFDFVEQIAKEQRPELYATEKSEKAR